MKLTKEQMEALAAMFPDGCDVIEGRVDGHVHAEPLGEGEKLNGVLIVDTEEGVGMLPITRESYFKLPEERRQTTEAVS